MASLEDLIPGFKNMTDEELERAVATGRLGGEDIKPKRAASTTKKAPKPDNLPDIDISDYE